MGEFLSNYGFFILIAVFMLFCHLGHGGHGRRGTGKDGEERPRPGGHQH